MFQRQLWWQLWRALSADARSFACTEEERAPSSVWRRVREIITEFYETHGETLRVSESSDSFVLPISFSETRKKEFRGSEKSFRMKFRRSRVDVLCRVEGNIFSAPLACTRGKERKGKYLSQR